MIPIVIIRPFTLNDAQAFHDLNMAWLNAFFHVEPKDEATLSDPYKTILAPGGQILMAEADGQTVGCVALVPITADTYEVAKMAVAVEVQGRGIGRSLLGSAIAWAREQEARRLYLESNARLGAALHLYEDVGFRHLPVAPSSPYQRADVFMEMLLDEKSV